MKKLRQSTVEPVFGSLTQYYSLRKIGVLGKAGAHKVMLMAAIAFNIKKYLNFSTMAHLIRQNCELIGKAVTGQSSTSTH